MELTNRYENLRARTNMQLANRVEKILKNSKKSFKDSHNIHSFALLRAVTFMNKKNYLHFVNR